VLPQDHDRGSKGRNQGLALQNNPWPQTGCWCQAAAFGSGS
jgi:hypothetical protein